MSFTLRSAVLGAALLSTQVTAAEFSFINGNPAPEAYGNSYSQTIDGLTTTATAWSTTGNGKRYETAELEIYSGYGMGVCNRDEGINCSNSGNMHALDNSGGAVDLILFRFSSPVQLTKLTLLQFGNDSDLSLWAGTGQLNLEGMKASSLGFETLAINTSRVNDVKTVNLSNFYATYDWLAVSARLSQTNDFAKLRTLYVQAAVSPVPEASNWAMLLAGLGLIGFTVHRRARFAEPRRI